MAVSWVLYMMQLHTLFGPAASVTGALGVLVWRVRETRRPVSAAAIVLPPIGMSTGFAMFAAPAMRVPPAWGAGALLVGALLFSVAMARTSRLEWNGDVIVMRRSRAFLAIIVLLGGLRFALRGYLDHIIPPLQTAALFYLLAFGMIATWRGRMYLQYRRLRARAEMGGARDEGSGLGERPIPR